MVSQMQQQHQGAKYGNSYNAQRRQWERNNPVLTDDSFVHANAEKMTTLHKTQPWKTAARYFQSVRVSVLAALQMMIHAKRGSPNSTCKIDAGSTTPAPDKSRRENWFEVMGMLIEHFSEHEMTVTEAFALPVDASEVECSMNEVSQMYLLDFLQYHQQGTGQEESGCIGWYHSHPGYTCFLSGTDVGTQQLGQSAQDPLAGHCC